jgi:hypothetical protein
MEKNHFLAVLVLSTLSFAVTSFAQEASSTPSKEIEGDVVFATVEIEGEQFSVIHEAGKFLDVKFSNGERYALILGKSPSDSSNVDIQLFAIVDTHLREKLFVDEAPLGFGYKISYENRISIGGIIYVKSPGTRNNDKTDPSSRCAKTDKFEICSSHIVHKELSNGD